MSIIVSFALSVLCYGGVVSRLDRKGSEDWWWDKEGLESV